MGTVPSPADPARPIVGIQVDQEADIELPFDVDIDLGPVGGPSAGLPFALEIARKLGRDVTNGCRVAATGALALDGTVLPVGGLEQKTFGARRSDVDVFLVPAGENAATAREHADGVRVVPVESFQQALQELATNRRSADFPGLFADLRTRAICGEFVAEGVARRCHPRQNAGWSTRGDLPTPWRRDAQRSPATTASSGAKGSAHWRATSPARPSAASTAGTLTPPRQPQLVPRPLPRVAVGHAA